MTNFTRVNPDSSDTRKSPLISALVFVTMTSLTPPVCNANFVSSNEGVMRSASTLGMNQAGWSLFIKEELEERSKNQLKAGKLAKSKGVDLPRDISNLPDETLIFLDNQDISPYFINATADGSLMIEFYFDGLYHVVEFWPDGDIGFLKKGNDATYAWDLNSQNYFDKLKVELLVEPQAELVE